jgi:hypothetical protein
MLWTGETEVAIRQAYTVANKFVKVEEYASHEEVPETAMPPIYSSVASVSS